jgi:hypothetical protein
MQAQVITRKSRSKPVLSSNLKNHLLSTLPTTDTIIFASLSQYLMMMMILPRKKKPKPLHCIADRQAIISSSTLLKMKSLTLNYYHCLDGRNCIISITNYANADRMDPNDKYLYLYSNIASREFLERIPLEYCP